MKISRASAPVRLSAVLVAASLMLGFATGCSRDPNKQKQKYLESGKRYANEGKLKEATIQFSNALKVDRNFANAHYELAKVYLKQGSVMTGYAELMRTIDLAPNNLEARIELGNLFVAGNALDKATEQAKAVLSQNTNSAEAYALLSAVAARKGDRATALTQIQKALSIDPNRAAFHTTLGLLQGSDPSTSSQAETELRKAVSLDDKNVASHIVLGSMLQRKGDLAGALEQMNAAVAADPHNIIARSSLADLYMRQNDTAKVEETLRKTADDLPEDGSATDMLATYYLRTHQLDHGAQVYSDLVSKHPKSAPLKLAYSRILIAQKDLTKARALGQELAKTDSELPQVAILNGMLMLNDGKTSDAFDTLQKASKSNPENLQVKIWLGRAAVAKGDTPAAQQAFRDAVRINPRSNEAQQGLAQISIDRRDFTTLAQLGDAAITSTPQSANGYIWRGMAEGSQRLNDKAEADFKEAIKVDPNNATGYLELAQLRLVQKNMTEAKSLLEQSLSHDPNSSRALRLLAAIYVSDKQGAKAVSRVQEQIAKSPQSADMYSLLAQLQGSTGDTAGAISSSEKAMQMNPNDPIAAIVYTRAVIASGDPGKAVAKWQQWTNDHPKDSQGFTILGTLQEAQGNRDQAIGSYKKALQIQPEQPIAANNLSYLMIETGQNIDVALSLAQVARRAMPNSPSTADTLAWAYYHKGNYTSARDLLEDAVKANPNDAALHYHLGLTYSKLSDASDATVHLKKAVTLAPNSQTAKDAEKALGQLS
ncbi:MAG TPA: tetratricopeptide repeat protein [Edaphobacter sp.]|nr:tetratricopeptide repeat protein [Edaphobacter sp.]